MRERSSRPAALGRAASAIRYSPAHQLTSSPAHQLTSSPAHQLTSSPAHQLTSSPALDAFQRSLSRLKPLAWVLATAGLLSLPAHAQLAANALPTGGVVAAGSASISSAGNALRIDQSSNKAVIDWQSFNIGSGASVRFNQPSSASITLNRVGADGGRSLINGDLSANGQVWLLNPGGALFGPTANINVGGLLASSLKLGNDDFMGGNFRLAKDGAGSIVNQGQLTAADGGYVALLAPEVRNEGIITARLGTVALASGDELRVDFTGDRLIEIKIDQATVNALIENKNLVEAEGGWVLMSTDAAKRLSLGAVNNSGIVRATTLSEHEGKIVLLGGTTTVAGTLDASAPQGGNGGFIETSGHTVHLDPSLKVNAAAPFGKTGNWLIDPNDFTIASSGGNITGAALSSNLASANVTISTATMGTPGGNGDIFVNDAVSWSSGTTLALRAERNVNINSNVAGTGVNSMFIAEAPGTLTVNASVTGTGAGLAANSDAVRYRADNMVLNGTTNAFGGSTSIAPYDANRSIRIESRATAGVLSLTPAMVSTLHGNSDHDIYIHTTNGDLFVTAGLAPSQINTGFFALKADNGNVTIDAPITAGAGVLGLGLDAQRNINIGGHITASATGAVLSLKSGGDITVPLASGFQLTADNLVIRSAGNVDLLGVYHPIGTLAANLTGAGKFFKFHAANTMTVGTVNGVSGITTNNGNVELRMFSGDLNVAGNINVGSGLMYLETNTDNALINLNSGASLTSTYAGQISPSACGNSAAICIKSDRMTIDGTVTALNQGVNLATEGSRAVVLGANDTNAARASGGTLGLTQAELNNVHAKGLHIGNDFGSTGGLGIEVNGTVNLANAANLGFSTNGDVTLNAPLTVRNNVAFLMSPTGNVRQGANGPLSAASLMAGGRSILLEGSSTNSIGAVAGNATGDFWVIGNTSSMTVASLSHDLANISFNGITAGHIGLQTNANLTLNAPLIVTSSGAINTAPTTWTDPLCTSSCVRPHIELYAAGNFTNNVGASVFTAPTGTFWALVTNMPSTTLLNGLSPSAVSFDASSIQGDILLSANRVFYRQQDTVATPPTTSPPASGQPTPSEPAPSQPPAVQPTPNEPAPSQPTAGQPTPSEPPPTRPTPSQPAPSEPVASQPTSAQPVTGQPAAYQPATTKAATTLTAASAATPTATTAPASVAATAPVGGTGNGGVPMNNFPAPSPSTAPKSLQPATSTPAPTTATPIATAALPSGETQAPPPPPKLIVDATKSMPKLAGVLKRPDLQAINQQIHEARAKLFAGALDILEKDPKAADVADCVEGATELCIAQVPPPKDGYLPVVKRRVALLIGNNAYRSPVPELETAINDVTAISTELRDKLGYEVKLVQNAGRKDMVEALNSLIRSMGPDDSVVIMYAGHGYLDDKTKAGYWIPTDGSASSPDKWISNDTIARALRNIPAKQIMLVSDSCYSGSLTKEGKQIDTVAISREQTLTRRSVLAFSSGGEEPVTDEGHDDHSIFAWNMIESLKALQAETSGQQLHASIKAAVAKEFPQVPQYGTVVSAGHAEGGEYLLTPKKDGVY